MKNPNSKGFTLVELMVAIAIVAILATIGLVIFQNTQKGARDARRRKDVQAVVAALEQRFNNTQNQNCGNGVGGIATGTNAAGGTYCPPQTAWFSAGLIPEDPQSTAPTPKKYRYWDKVAATASDLSAWTSTAVAKFSICANLENAGGNAYDDRGTRTGTGAKNYFCLDNQQQ